MTSNRMIPEAVVLTNKDGVHDLEVNAFQRVSEVVVQKSLKEGFGLTVTEAMWKGKPVVGGNTGGIKLQIQDGVTGYLVNSVQETAIAILRVLNDPVHSVEIGRRAHEFVARNYLLPTNLENYLKLFRLAKGSTQIAGIYNSAH